MLFEWKEKYSCGISSIDDQHKIIFNLINELYDSIQNRKGEGIIKKVFVDLMQYANYHFNLEFELFQLYKYQDEEKHIEEHKVFIQKIESMMIHNYLTEKDNLKEALVFLVDWFSNHILKTDMEYCNFFRFREVIEEVNTYIAINKFAKSYKG